MARVDTEDILEKIRETVDHEGHGNPFVFVILGASVSFFGCMVILSMRLWIAFL